MSEASRRSARTRSTAWRPTVEALEERTVPTAMVAVTTANELFLFNSETPEQGRIVQLQGMEGGENLYAVDYRPETGYLVGVARSGNLYRINPNTGAALLDSRSLPLPGGGDPDADADVDPISGQLRVVTRGITQAGERAYNFRINLTVPSFPIGVDPELNNGTGLVVQGIEGLAYPPDGSHPYVIDVSNNRLARLNPSTGVVTPSGYLGVGVGSASFDIAPDGKAFAMLDSFTGGRKLYTINLSTGNAAEIGVIGNGNLQGTVIEIATLGPPPPKVVALPPPITGDVTGLVQATAVKVKPKKGSRKRVERWTFTNSGANPILAPLRLIVARLNTRIKLLNKSGALKPSKTKIEPYQTWNGGTLAAGQSVTFTLEFSVPDGVGLRYGWRLTAGGV